MNFREKIIELREFEGLAQWQLAKNLDISESAIKKYESPTTSRIPSVEILKKYATFFKVSFEYLLDDTIENKTTENIEIEKILKLNDKAISNLKRNEHNGINLLLESNYFLPLNDLIDFYFKFKSLSAQIKALGNSRRDKEIWASGIKNIIKTYDEYCKENSNISIYANGLEEPDCTDLDVLEGYPNDEDILGELVEAMNDIYTKLENAQRIIKLEIVEYLLKFLN